MNAVKNLSHVVALLAQLLILKYKQSDFGILVHLVISKFA